MTILCDRYCTGDDDLHAISAPNAIKKLNCTYNIKKRHYVKPIGLIHLKMFIKEVGGYLYMLWTTTLKGNTALIYAITLWSIGDPCI